MGEHQLPLELMCHMVMLPAETMLLILLELSILPREKLMLSQRLMLSMDMDTTILDMATLDSQHTQDQLSLATLGQLSQDLLFQATPDQLFLVTQALEGLEVFGKSFHSLQQPKQNRNSN